MLGKAVDRGLRVNEAKLAERRTDPFDKLHQSFSGLWKLRGQRKRQIPVGARIHASVVERANNPHCSYKPSNVSLTRNGNQWEKYEIVE